MAQAGRTHTTRRALAGVGLFAFATLPTVATADNRDRLLAELRETAAWGDRLNTAVPVPTLAEWDAWEAADIAIIARIEALPVTVENASLKARACAVIWHNDSGNTLDGNTADVRLARQVLKAMAGAN